MYEYFLLTECSYPLEQLDSMSKDYKSGKSTKLTLVSFRHDSEEAKSYRDMFTVLADRLHFNGSSGLNLFKTCIRDWSFLTRSNYRIAVPSREYKSKSKITECIIITKAEK